MQCSKEEIERKRRLALDKLARKSSQDDDHIRLSKSPRLATNTNPGVSKYKFKNTTKTYGKKTVTEFYGDKKKIIGDCTLITEDRFTVIQSGFNQMAIEVFKSIPSRNYEPKTRNWDFHVNDHDLLLGKMNSLKTVMEIHGLPSFVLNCIKVPKRNTSTINLDKISGKLRQTLMPFQEEGVRYGIDKNGRCLIADDMGLGKTFQALAIADYYKDNWPVLIITTASMKNIWEQHIHDYISVPLMEVQYMETARDYIGDARILIVSYDMMSRSLEKLLEKKFGVMIVDESHNLKNFKAKCTKAAIELAKIAKRLILLSGTPVLSRPSELYTQLSMINPTFFGSFFDYSRRYCDGKTSKFGWDATGKSNLQELEIILNRQFMIRRSKEDVLKSLPDKSQEIVPLDVNYKHLSENDQKCMDDLAEKYRVETNGSSKHAALLTFFAETARIKIPLVCTYILKLLDKKPEKFIVFAHHQKMLNAIADVLNRKNIYFIRIDGSTTSEQRKFFVDKFQYDDTYVCALLSITAANAGLTLTAANLVIFAELHWNPSILSQAESRAHRIGQTREVKVIYLLAKGTADDSIWLLLQRKQKVLDEVGLCKENFEDVTCAHPIPTNEITKYFPKIQDSTDIFDDGFDDILSSIDI